MATEYNSPSATWLAARFASPCAALAMLVGAVFCVPACGSSGGGANIADTVAALCPATPNRRQNNTPAMTGGDFCQLYFQTCIGANAPAGGYATLEDCKTAYANLTFDNTRACRSYHVCNAVSYDTLNAQTHCGHAIGMLLCADDGSGQ